MTNKDGINSLHIVAFTHRSLSVSDIGQLHIAPENQQVRLVNIKDGLNLGELMFLSTCNRIEYSFTTKKVVDTEFIEEFLKTLYPEIETNEIRRFSESSAIYTGMEAAKHLLEVASSVDSMVVGEREIITQVRKAYNDSKSFGITGDLLRILVRHTIETAKKVYTETNIAKRPVSVVSLAYHQLRDMNVPLDSRILIIGAGTTNVNMSRFLKKHGFTNFNVFNRTFEKAKLLAQDLNGTPHRLSELDTFSEGFDIIITCTGAESHIISPQTYKNLLQGETRRKIVIDIAIPQDLSPEIKNNHSVHHISVEALQKISTENLKARSKEVESVHQVIDVALGEFDKIYQERSVVVAMKAVPNKVKEIKKRALTEVFKEDIETLDDDSKEVLEKVLGYMEKKYISMPMLMAKEILIKKSS
ncbi:MAG: glutamyl-tRNA reductase [Crocinitomicaceae bacterium]|nr:glutamyl-tRNA reductase [Crocinitomicaceae bacterium]